jgi:ABC-2 type transport system ATP-binding protein
MTDLIKLDRVSVKFGKNEVVHAFSHVFQSEPKITGLIGPNGAGKTTIISTLFGLVPLSNGVVTVDDTDVAYCPDTPEFNPCLTAIQTLEEAASLHGKRNMLKENLSDVITKVGLQKYNSTYVGNFSRGMKQRLGIAVALILQPDILFLDEPTSALDPFGREAVLELISDIGSNIPVVFSSHALDDVQRIADELLVLDKGSLLYSGTLERFLSKNGDLSIIRVVSSRASEKITKILGANGIKSVFLSQDKLCISIESTAYKKAWGVLGDVSDLILGFERYSTSLWTAFSAAIKSYEKTGRCHE